MWLDPIRSFYFAGSERLACPAARFLAPRAHVALVCAALAGAAPGLGGCVGSGAQVASSHPAAASSAATPLPVVAASLTSEEAVSADPATDHSGHAGHTGHAGHMGHAGHGQHGGGHAH